MSRMAAAVLALALAGAATASETDPAGGCPGHPTPGGTTGAEGLTGYTDHAVWLAAAGTTTLIDFEGFTSGTVITDQLADYGIAMVSGESGSGVPIDQIVLSSGSLPFPMFVAGTLPTEPNFMSNDMTSPYYATGRMTLELSGEATALGLYVTDQSPLGDFSFELWSGSTNLGTVTVPPRTLPDSFAGVISDDPFDRAVISSTNTGDSWGMDNLELNDAAALEEGTWGAIKSSVGC